MAFIDDDISAFFSGLDEVTITFNGATALGHFNSPAGEFAFGGPLSATEARRYYVDLPGDAFNPQPQPRDKITVTDQLAGAVPYTVTKRRYSEDGRVLTLELAL